LRSGIPATTSLVHGWTQASMILWALLPGIDKMMAQTGRR
jgi:hypothetical protein